MVSEPKTVEVEPGSELDRLLDEAAKAPLRLVRNGARFRLVPEDGDEWAGPDLGLAREGRSPSAEQVARSIAGIRKAAGSWKDVDVEALKADLRERRRTAKRRPPVRL